MYVIVYDTIHDLIVEVCGNLYEVCSDVIIDDIFSTVDHLHFLTFHFDCVTMVCKTVYMYSVPVDGDDFCY